MICLTDLSNTENLTLVLMEFYITASQKDNFINVKIIFIKRLERFTVSTFNMCLNNNTNSFRDEWFYI